MTENNENASKNEKLHNKSNHSVLLKENCNFWRQFTYTLAAASVTLISGITNGQIASLNRKILSNEFEFPTIDEDTAKLTNYASRAHILGPIVYTYFINHMGRKFTLLLAVIPVLTNCIILFFATNINQVVVGVTIGAVPTLMIPAVVGVYISEITSPHLRGSMISLSTLAYLTGTVVGTILDWLLPLRHSTIVLFIIYTFIAILMLLIPESPYFFIKRGQYSKAKHVLGKLYNKNVAEVECTRLRQHFDMVTQSAKGWRDILTTKQYGKPLLLLMNLFFIKYFCGTSTFMWFCPLLLSQAKYRYLSPLSCQIIILVATIPLAMVNTVILRYARRRVYGIISFSAAACVLLSITIYYYLIETGNEYVQDVHDFLPFLLFLAQKIAITLGPMSLPYVYFRELIQIEVLAYSSFVADMWVPLCKSVCVFCFNLIRMYISYSGCFGFFFICVVVSGTIFIVTTPETKNMCLEDVHEKLEQNSGESKRIIAHEDNY